ncbi:hypothetical protein FB567DRAFT_618132 [Paraphoma chrysanthemicola]|uniref:Uncharacterized protein n=1 Tax=Paraphoma chrysanthemicola TaxID=798071 RepID=A0A8K0W1J5_9PLEO|nr:hypothetical protein FB567DRAFT_618132 [Paraphoma chrysanthemicola]
MAAVLAAVLQSNIPGLEPELTERLIPKHEPYGQAIVITVEERGDKLQSCYVDYFNAWKDAFRGQKLKDVSQGDTPPERVNRIKFDSTLSFLMTRARYLSIDFSKLAIVMRRICERDPSLKNNESDLSPLVPYSITPIDVHTDILCDRPTVGLPMPPFVHLPLQQDAAELGRRIRQASTDNKIVSTECIQERFTICCDRSLLPLSKVCHY